MDIETIKARIAEQYRKDQDAMKAGNWEEAIKIVEESTEYLKEVFEFFKGWPKISQVGLNCSQDAWLLAQHSDSDPAFQRKCLESMLSLPPDEVVKRNVVFLHDRVLKNEGKPQMYGTQMLNIGDTEGEALYYPIEDINKVDLLRKSVGLDSLEEHARKFTTNFKSYRVVTMDEYKAYKQSKKNKN